MSQEKNNIEKDTDRIDKIDKIDNPDKVDDVNKTNSDKNAEKNVEKKRKFKKSDILVFAVCIISAVAIWLYASNIEKKDEAEKIKKEDIPTKEDISEIVGDLNKNESATGDVVQ